jgi:hypothetical protein
MRKENDPDSEQDPGGPKIYGSEPLTKINPRYKISKLVRKCFHVIKMM